MATIAQSLEELLTLDGAIAAGLVDSTSGMLLGSAGSGFNMEAAAAGNTDVIRAKLATIKALDLNDQITDILITLGKQYHIIRPLPGMESIFVYLVLNKTKANLALARMKTEYVAGALILR